MRGSHFFLGPALAAVGTLRLPRKKMGKGGSAAGRGKKTKRSPTRDGSVGVESKKEPR